MSEQPYPPSPAREIADFTPVPRATNRADGWKPEVQRAFIEALADTGSVASACRMVRRSERSAYALRRHPEAGEFAAAWLAAQGHGILRLQDAVIDRALNGVEVPVVYHGEIVGTAKKYDNRLACFILRNHLPGQYGEAGFRRPHAIDRRKLERLKREWREEWEAERLAAERKEEAETLESLDAFFEGLRQRRLANEAIEAESETAAMSPRERAAWEEYQRIRAEERGEAEGSGEDAVDGGELVAAPAPEASDDSGSDQEPASATARRPARPEPSGADAPRPASEGANKGIELKSQPPPRQPAPARWNPAHGPPPWAQRMWR